MRRLAVLSLVLLALVASCSSSDDDSSTTTSADSQATADQGASVDASTGPQVGDRAAAKPEVPIPDPVPTELYTEDLIVGDGPEVPEGATVTVEYVGVTTDGNEFDASWNRPEPIAFGLDQVIAGWTQGIPGMRVGGRRLLVIPGELAYGEAGQPPDIGPNETLVFVVDLLDFEEAPATGAIPGGG